MIMPRKLIGVAAILGMLGVALGAFGAHALAEHLTANGRADTYDTAVQYHLIHALAIFAAVWLTTTTQQRLPHYAGWCFVLGVVLFSGSLYVLAIFDLGMMGAVAPFGGVALIVGWGLLGWTAFRENSPITPR